MIWVVDDGPLGDLAYELDPDWRWPAGTLHVVQAVAAAASLDKSGRRGAILAMSAAGDLSITVHAVVEGSAASDYLWGHLRTREKDATNNLGEHESIAWMRHDGPQDSVFVAKDKGAAFLALAELGPGRVATPFDLWTDLRARKLIETRTLEALVDRTAKRAGLSIPTRLGL